MLDLQSRVADEVTRCGTALAEIAQAQHTAVGGIFMRDRPPIWSAELWAQVKATLPARSQSRSCLLGGIRQYVGDPSRGMPLHAGLFVGLVLLLRAARRQVDRWAASGEGTPAAARVSIGLTLRR